MTTPTLSSNERRAPVEFSASAWGYTKLWLVNLVLTVITLGIYGPWAKVRNNQYLFGHTQVEKHRLEYLADPMKILMGRILATALFLIAWSAASLIPEAIIVFYLALIFATPWLVIQGLRFTYRNTAYRNIRFDFEASYMSAFVHFIILPILAVFTVFLALPWVIKKIHQFIYGNCSFGGHDLELETRTGKYYIAAIVVTLVNWVVLMTLMGAMGVTAAIAEVNNDGGSASFTQMVMAMVIPLTIMFYLGGFLTQAIFNAMIRNHIVNSLSADGLARFESNITVLGYLWMTTTNALLLVITLGLAFPATRVRRLRYLASCTSVVFAPGIDHLANTVSGKEGAFGEEAAGVFDSDLSFV